MSSDDLTKLCIANAHSEVRALREQLAAARKEIDRLRELTEWRPIDDETPKGVPILVYEDEFIVVARRVISFQSVPGQWAVKPTHWMPLPPPPQKENA